MANLPDRAKIIDICPNTTKQKEKRTSNRFEKQKRELLGRCILSLSAVAVKPTKIMKKKLQARSQYMY